MSKNFRQLIRNLRTNPPKFSDPFEAGKDCAANGADLDNCHFGWFSTPERTKEWERGKSHHLQGDGE